MSEPREWWIDPHEHSAPYRSRPSGKFTAWDDNVRPGLIHVIEYSTYDSLNKKMELAVYDEKRSHDKTYYTLQLTAANVEKINAELSQTKERLAKTVMCLRQIYEATACDVWPRSLIMDVRRDISLDMDWKKKE